MCRKKNFNIKKKKKKEEIILRNYEIISKISNIFLISRLSTIMYVYIYIYIDNYIDK